MCSEEGRDVCYRGWEIGRKVEAVTDRMRDIFLVRN